MKNVAVIINNKNDGKYIHDIIKAFREQDNQDFDIYGIDAGSTDESVEIYQHYHIPVIKCGDLNQAQSVNKVMQITEEPFIHWINVDDMPMPNFISKHLEVFQDPTIGIVYSDCLIIREYHPEWVPHKWKARDLKSEFLAGRNPIIHPTAMIKRSVFDTIGELDESFIYTIDYEFWSRTWKKGIKFYHIQEPTAIFRAREDSLTATKGKNIWQEIYRVHKMYGFGKHAK